MGSEKAAHLIVVPILLGPECHSALCVPPGKRITQIARQSFLTVRIAHCNYWKRALDCHNLGPKFLPVFLLPFLAHQRPLPHQPILLSGIPSETNRVSGLHKSTVRRQRPGSTPAFIPLTGIMVDGRSQQELMRPRQYKTGPLYL